MSEPSWKTFVDNLKGVGKRSQYDKKMPPGAVSNGLAGIQRELVEEMSDGLRRAAQKIEKKLVKLADLDDAIRAADERERQLRLVEQFNERRAEALEARRYYLIQREAIGFFRNDEAVAQWPIPPRRAVVGPHGEDGSLDTDCEE